MYFVVLHTEQSEITARAFGKEPNEDAQKIIDMWGSREAADREITAGIILGICLIISGLMVRKLHRWAYWMAIGLCVFRIVMLILMPWETTTADESVLSTIFHVFLPTFLLVLLLVSYRAYMNAAKAKWENG